MKIPKELHDKILKRLMVPKEKPPNTDKQPAIPARKSIITTNKSSKTVDNVKNVKFAVECENLGVGTFDEMQSHDYFLEALNEFRALKKPVSEPKPEENIKDDKKSSAFFYNNNAEWTNTFIDQAIGSDKAIIKKNLSNCWECLGSFEKNAGFSFNSKVNFYFN